MGYRPWGCTAGHNRVTEQVMLPTSPTPTPDDSKQTSHHSGFGARVLS